MGSELYEGYNYEDLDLEFFEIILMDDDVMMNKFEDMEKFSVEGVKYMCLYCNKFFGRKFVLEYYLKNVYKILLWDDEMGDYVEYNDYDFVMDMFI